MKNVVVIDALRTPIGSFGGRLSSMNAPELASVAIGALYKNNSLNPDLIDEVIMGNALPAGLGQGPARQAALKAGLKNTTPCTTINKVCSSGMKAVMIGMHQIACGDGDVIVAGGMESMSNVPYYLPKHRFGSKPGHHVLQDGIIQDGLQDAFKDWQMGNAAELCAQKFDISRNEQDEYALTSYERAQSARDKGVFSMEITAVKVRNNKGEAEVIVEDEEAGRVNLVNIPKYGPAFQKNGTITIANAASISDGAAALLLMSEEKANELGLTPMARLISQASSAGPPADYITAPADAISQALNRAGKSINDIDLFEINEPFAVSALAHTKLLEIPTDTLNIHGGAVSLGHPIGCSGARILVTLLQAMKHHDKQWGCASVANGGGEASAVTICS